MRSVIDNYFYNLENNEQMTEQILKSMSEFIVRIRESDELYFIRKFSEHKTKTLLRNSNIESEKLNQSFTYLKGINEIILLVDRLDIDIDKILRHAEADRKAQENDHENFPLQEDGSYDNNSIM